MCQTTSGCCGILTFLAIYYRPQTKLRKGNLFTSVCWEFCPQGGGVHPPRQNPPPSRHPPGQTPTLGRHTLWADTIPPGRWILQRMAHILQEFILVFHIYICRSFLIITYMYNLRKLYIIWLKTGIAGFNFNTPWKFFSYLTII